MQSFLHVAIFFSGQKMNDDKADTPLWGERLRKEVKETEHLELVGCHIISSLGTALTVSSNQELCVSLEYL